MKNLIENTISDLARRTHSPRGKFAATDQNYQSLLDRIPGEQRPVIAPHIGRRPIVPRWSAAACLLLVIGLGLAIAGVWYHQYYNASSAHECLPSADHDVNQSEPRTLIYQSTPLGDIIADLAENYSASIQISDPELANYCITATFSTDESLDEILSILAEIGDFEVQKTTEGIILNK